ncbi:MAG: GTP 3',8-cyclase MoaA [Selenomonadaceae bacterium]|nr:GTP 3',8-cyclase MoaA [Selenomonadaceae bacterium]
MIDQFNRKIEYVRISVTDRCNLRCRYCMPEHGVFKLAHEDILTFEEILTVVKIFAALGIRKIRLTGGEPLLRRNIVELVRNIKSVDGIEKVAITTNGVLLDKMVDALIEAGLDSINLSLDTLNKKIFNQITRRPMFEAVVSSLHKIIAANCEVKINCVPIVGLNDADIIELVSLARDNDIKVRFIELMPIGCASIYKGIPMSAIRNSIEEVYGHLMPLSKDELQGPAEYFSLRGFVGRIGFIDAIDHKFCSHCNRVRLTSDGFLKLCLNSQIGLDVKSLLRSGVSENILMDEMRRAIYNKPQEHHFENNVDKTKMYQVGG